MIDNNNIKKIVVAVVVNAVGYALSTLLKIK